MGATSSSVGDCEAALGSPIKLGLTKARFEEIYQKGKRVSGEFCRLMALPGIGRVGFATPKSVGNTPRRNKMKRRFRAAVLETGRPQSLDLVVAISSKADRVPYASIRIDLESAMGRMIERWASESESS